MTCSAIHTALPDSNILLALEPEELGGVVLELLKAQVGNSGNRSNKNFQRVAFIHLDKVQGYPIGDRQAILDALSESWNWLESAGLIAQSGDDNHIVCFITRRGYQIKTKVDFETFLKARLLPRELLHPLIAEPVWLLFIRGRYETAVFEAYKEVEVTIRTASRLLSTDIGVKLMRKAFDFIGHHAEMNGCQEEKKRGRESFLDRIVAVSVEHRPCHAVHVSLLETSPIMS